MRVTADEVMELLPVNDLCNTDIDPFIVTANCVVDEIATGCLLGASEKILKQVEMYYAAHLATFKDQTLNITNEKDACSGATATYGGKLGTGVKSTRYGQMADDLSKGCLSAKAAESDPTTGTANGTIFFASIGCS